LKTRWIVILALLFCSTAHAGFQWGSGFSQADLEIKKHSVVCGELDADPAIPLSDEGNIYCKDDGGTTTPYFIDSSGTVTSLLGGGGGSSEWTDVSGEGLHPNESTADNVFIGGTSLAGADIILGVAGGATFNEASNDQDFRVESDNNTHALFVDAGSDRVQIGSAAGMLLSTDGSATFTDVTVSNLSASECVTTDGSSKLVSTGSACGSGGGEWTDSGDFLRPSDLSGAETIVIGGTAASAADIILGATGGATFNDQGSNVDFRIESVGHSDMVLVDADTNELQIGGSDGIRLGAQGGATFGGTDSKFTGEAGQDIDFNTNEAIIFSDTNSITIDFNETNIELVPSTSAIEIGASGAIILAASGDSTFGDVTISSLTASECVTTDGSKKLVSTGSACGSGGGEWTDGGNFLYPADLSGVETVVLGGTDTASADIILGSDGSATFNDAGSAVDFRVEGDNDTHLLFVDASADAVGINQSAPTASIHAVSEGTDGTFVMKLHASGSSGDLFQMLNSSTNEIFALRQGSDGRGIFRMQTAAGSPTIEFDAETGQEVYFNNGGFVLIGGTLTGNSDIAFASTGAATFNEQSNDVDFVIESNNVADAFVVDGGLDQVFIGGSDAIILDTDGQATFSQTVRIPYANASECLTTDANKAIVSTGSACGSGSGIADVVEDLTPQLGGGLDMNGFDITSSTNLTIGAEGGATFTQVTTNSADIDFLVTGDATFTTLGDGTIIVDAILDEDDMVSDSATALATQQSIKAYVDSQAGGSSEWTDGGNFLYPGDLTGAETVLIGGEAANTSDIVLGANGSATFNEQAADVDFRVESVGHADALLVDASVNEVLIGGSDGIRLGATGTATFNGNSVTIGTGGAVDQILTFNADGTSGYDATITLKEDENYIALVASGLNDAGSSFQPLMQITNGSTNANAGLILETQSNGNAMLAIGESNDGYAYVMMHDGISDGGGLGFYRDVIYGAEENGTDANFRSNAINGDNRTNGTVSFGDSTHEFNNAYLRTIFTNLIDGNGAVDIDYGSADVTDHTFVSDGGTVIIDGGITVDSDISLGADGSATFNDAGSSLDFRVETNTETEAFLVDGSADKVFFFGSDGVGNIELGADGSMTFNSTGATTYSSFAAGVQFFGATSDPCASTSGFPAGSMFYNQTSGYPCYCSNANADLKVSDDSACF
jgi:hypothetical protein